MGEIAEMMLEGILCEACGAFIDGEPTGFPGYCSRACARDRGALSCDPPHKSAAVARKAQRVNNEREMAAGGIRTFRCVQCTKRFRFATALAQHERDKHATPESRP